MSSAQIFPDVLDGTTFGGVQSPIDQFAVGIEGQAAAGGTAVLNEVREINRVSEAIDAFGAAASSPLVVAIQEVLNQNVSPVYAVASKATGAAPTLVERQAAWANLESDRRVRLRLSDGVGQAILDAMGDSCDNANLLQNKQVAIGGLQTANAKAALITSANAINSKRAVLVAPGVYDNNNVLKTGNFAAYHVAARVAKNVDLADDLDLVELPDLLGIERDATLQPVFKRRVVAGVEVNDFEDLLQAGVSPLMPGINGGVAISHLRMTYSTDETFDSLMTRMIVDQSFVIVRDYCLNFNYLRRPNTATNRESLRSGVEALLKEHSDWIKPRTGQATYQVSVLSSNDQRQLIVNYKGQVIRGIQTILVDADLQIPVS